MTAYTPPYGWAGTPGMYVELFNVVLERPCVTKGRY